MELGLIEALLQGIFPQADGWQLRKDCVLEDVAVHYVFYRKGDQPVAALRMDSPYVNATDLQLVRHLKERYAKKMNGRQLHVMLVYRNLLMRPQRILKGMSVVSLTEVDADEKVWAATTRNELKN